MLLKRGRHIVERGTKFLNNASTSVCYARRQVILTASWQTLLPKPVPFAASKLWLAQPGAIALFSLPDPKAAEPSYGLESVNTTKSLDALTNRERMKLLARMTIIRTLPLLLFRDARLLLLADHCSPIIGSSYSFLLPQRLFLDLTLSS